MKPVVSINDLPPMQSPQGIVSGRFVLEGYLHGLNHLMVIMGDSPPGSSIPLHSHNYEEVFIVHSGRGTYTVGDTTIEAGPGDVVLIPSGAWHCFVNNFHEPLSHTAVHSSGKIEAVSFK